MQRSSTSTPQIAECIPASTRWLFQTNGQIITEANTSECLSVLGREIRTDTRCDEKRAHQIWQRSSTYLVHQATGHCLDVLDEVSLLLVVTECDVRSRPTQIWHFTVDRIRQQ